MKLGQGVDMNGEIPRYEVPSIPRIYVNPTSKN